MKNISILGSTGSIGVNTLDVVSNYPDKFKVIGMTAGRNIDLFAKQVREFKPIYAAVITEEDSKELASLIGDLNIEVLFGVEAFVKISTADEIDTVVSAIVGAAGLLPTISAVRAGKNVALANKESLVLAGSLIKKEDPELKSILPVDSEHSAVFQSLNGENRREIKKIILTASGGPFRNHSIDDLKKVSVKDALNHPNWSMGKKITIDSATLMNKGLEVIEAKWLFGVRDDQIDVVVHPQSIIHSLVEFVDGSVIAQLGLPDMKLPIAYALTYPERCEFNSKSLDLAEIGNLTFNKPDKEKFPCLRLAYDAMKFGKTMPTVLNAANEIAVEAFLDEKISFLEIPKLIEDTMKKHEPFEVNDVDDILKADNWARVSSRQLI